MARRKIETHRDAFFDLDGPLGELAVLSELLIDQTLEMNSAQRDWNNIDYLVGRVVETVRQVKQNYNEMAEEIRTSREPA